MWWQHLHCTSSSRKHKNIVTDNLLLSWASLVQWSALQEAAIHCGVLTCSAWGKIANFTVEQKVNKVAIAFYTIEWEIEIRALMKRCEIWIQFLLKRFKCTFLHSEKSNFTHQSLRWSKEFKIDGARRKTITIFCDSLTYCPPIASSLCSGIVLLFSKFTLKHFKVTFFFFALRRLRVCYCLSANMCWLRCMLSCSDFSTY